MVGHCAFVRLKGQLSVLRKAIYTELKSTLNIIDAWFVFHNVCGMNKEQRWCCLNCNTE